ncbi:MAG: guanine deaminase [Burkholderiales bacterium]
MKAFRGTLVYFTGDPRVDRGALRFIEDGLLLLDGGRIVSAAPYDERPGVDIVDYRGKLLIPGFVDAHVHSAQTDVIASPSDSLLDWLERHTFPAEARFADAAYAHQASEYFIDELLRNGTTTAAVFPSVHPESVDALFEAAERRGLRMAAGKVMMDRHCPQAVRDEAESSYRDSQALIRRWHGRARLAYAVTPRFAPTSSERQLELAGRLLEDHAGVLLQTHLSETEEEVRWVRQLFPWANDYLDVYERYGMIRPGALFAHCLHLEGAEWDRLAAGGAAAVHCPSSNLFLGSGLFDLAAACRSGAAVCLGTDVAGGTSFSMLRTMHDAHKVARMRRLPFDALDGFYLATLGGATALGMQERIGSFQPGREADFIVLRPDATPLLARRMAQAESIEARLFLLMTLGDERAVEATYILGEMSRVSS